MLDAASNRQPGEKEQKALVIITQIFETYTYTHKQKTKLVMVFYMLSVEENKYNLR